MYHMYLSRRCFYLTRIPRISQRTLAPPVLPFGTMQSVFGSKDSGGVNFFEELRPEGPKAHSPGQGEQREPTPWVCSGPTTWRPERAKALNHKTVCGLSRICVGLLPFQGATYVWGFCPRVSLLAVACPGLGDIALSGRGMIVLCSTC